MELTLSWLTLPFFLIAFIGVLVGYHPILVAANLFGERAFRFFFYAMNYSVLMSLRIAGTKFRVEFEEPLPLGQPLIVVSNHQSMFDIPFLIWNFRSHHPVFVAKKELGRWLPSISFSLNHMGSVLIDRSDPIRAVRVIADFGKLIEAKKAAGFIFPEGTRARDGVMKAFKAKGVKTLLENAPHALLVPVAITNSWKLVAQGLFPVPWGTVVTLHVKAPLARRGENAESLVQQCEAIIRKTLTDNT